MAENSEKILTVKNLTKHFPIRRGVLRRVVGQVHAVNDISFDLAKGETLSLVGESGSGKSTTARAVIRAIEPTAGEILFRLDGNMVDIAKLRERALRRVWRNMQMIFQDPFSSLNGRYTVRDIIGESLKVHGLATGRAIDKRVADLLRAVDLDPIYIKSYPHAFSGGQRQRIGVARALALNPQVIFADEPTSALDVSVQAQILNLLIRLRKEFHLSYLFISHDMSVIRHISDRVAVMYAGEIVEIADTESLFLTPRHPYTEALLSAVPRPNPHHKSNKILLAGEVADPSNLPEGCCFHPRCKYAQDSCKKDKPYLSAVSDGNKHEAACHFSADLDLSGVAR